MHHSHLFAQQQRQEEKFASLLSPNLFTPGHTPNQQRSYGQSPYSKNNYLPTTEKLRVPGKMFLEQNKELNRGHWLQIQNKKYHWFLEIHYQHFVNRQMRRMDRIFKTMENFIGTRQAEQCRSHHQKMEKKFHCFSAIIRHLRLQHYSTLEVEPLVEDLKSNGHQLEDQLATISMLQVEQQLLVGVELKEKKKSTSIRSEKAAQKSRQPKVVQEEVKQRQEIPQFNQNEGIPINMLEESNPNIGELMLFHDRDENSAFFSFQ